MNENLKQSAVIVFLLFGWVMFAYLLLSENHAHKKLRDAEAKLERCERGRKFAFEKAGIFEDKFLRLFYEVNAPKAGNDGA